MSRMLCGELLDGDLITPTLPHGKLFCQDLDRLSLVPSFHVSQASSSADISLCIRSSART